MFSTPLPTWFAPPGSLTSPRLPIEYPVSRWSQQEEDVNLDSRAPLARMLIELFDTTKDRAIDGYVEGPS